MVSESSNHCALRPSLTVALHSLKPEYEQQLVGSFQALLEASSMEAKLKKGIEIFVASIRFTIIAQLLDPHIGIVDEESVTAALVRNDWQAALLSELFRPCLAEIQQRCHELMGWHRMPRNRH